MAENSALLSLARQIRSHDLTFIYSDDGAAYRRGEASLDAIRNFVKRNNIPQEKAKEIWDEQVNKKIVEGYREPFYWKIE